MQETTYYTQHECGPHLELATANQILFILAFSLAHTRMQACAHMHAHVRAHTHTHLLLNQIACINILHKGFSQIILKYVHHYSLSWGICITDPPLFHKQRYSRNSIIQIVSKCSYPKHFKVPLINTYLWSQPRCTLPLLK